MEDISNKNNEIIFNLKNFNGPLDLLVTLIKEKNVDIFDINLSELATQYLQIIENMNKIDIDIASEYLVMAANLIHLKARIILQSPQEEEEIKKEKIRLLSQIAEYQKFKEISLTLREQEQERKQLFQKSPSDLTSFVKEIDESVLDGHSSSTRLTIILRKMFERTYAEALKNISLQTQNISPEEMKKVILDLFKTKDILTFNEIFTVPTMGHFVISLLALLDLSRQQKVVIEANNESEIIKISKGIKYE
ncbi:segregation/condensation protein A [Mycoplasma miroungirhinis]|uniref:Segregation and condensation protein A n=1 Tax=Mycoplasma miroungirhinis TaxID=754516 RepID=A0A6M4JAV0_9MOLU|nr:segregation/condensation protein A [Mycoplasma miroungirhinis]QJR44030.1 segregation/condensation protein A [Mycoplasma miroungirhinis]